METRQYCGNRKNCLHTMYANCGCETAATYNALHEKVQQTLHDTAIPSCSCTTTGTTGEKNTCSSASLCPSLPYVTAYVNPQDYTGLVSPEMALTRGSSFNNLYWPYNECRR